VRAYSGGFTPLNYVLDRKKKRYMDVIDKQTDENLLKSVLAEVAKAKNEIKCARADLEKATSRLNFTIVVANKLIERKGDR